MLTTELRRNRIHELITVESDPCISIYLPTHKYGSETKEDIIRFKNLLRQCERRLNNRGITGETAEQILRPGTDLLAASIVWQHLEQALAVFISPDFFRAITVPLECQEQAWVTTHFYIKPLVPLLGPDNRFWILALSRGQVRLYEADRWGMCNIPLEGAPNSLEDFLKYDEAQERLQYHTAPSGKSTGTGAVFHGHGNIADKARQKRCVSEYVKAARKAVEKRLAAENWPLVLVAPEYIQSTYRDVSHYSHLLPSGVQRSPDRLGEAELYEAASAITQPHFKKTICDRLGNYLHLIDTSNASGQIEQIVPAASEGRIRTLLVDPTVSVRGYSGIASEGGEEELLDLAVRCTLAQGGEVYAVDSQDMPSQSPAGAIFRY
jgi:hypothetical protein